MKKMLGMLPFLDETQLDELADKVMAAPDSQYEGVRPIHLAPFLSTAKVDELFLSEVRKNGAYHGLVPFVSGQALEDMVDRCLASGGGIDVVSLAPFMDDGTVDKLFAKAVAGEVPGIDMIGLLPFVSDDSLIDEAFIQAVRQGKEYRKLLPFVSNRCMHKLAQAYCQGQLDPAFDIDQLYPFMEDDDIKMIFHHAMGQPQDGDHDGEADQPPRHDGMQEGTEDVKNDIAAAKKEANATVKAVMDEVGPVMRALKDIFGGKDEQ